MWSDLGEWIGLRGWLYSGESLRSLPRFARLRHSHKLPFGAIVTYLTRSGRQVTGSAAYTAAMSGDRKIAVASDCAPVTRDCPEDSGLVTVTRPIPIFIGRSDSPPPTEVNHPLLHAIIRSVPST
jgi:hypothetical protein